MKIVLVILLTGVSVFCGYLLPCHAENTVEILVVLKLDTVLNQPCNGAEINASDIKNNSASAKEITSGRETTTGKKPKTGIDGLTQLPKGVISSHRIPGSSILRMNVSSDSAEEVVKELRGQKNVLSVEVSGRGKVEENRAKVEKIRGRIEESRVSYGDSGRYENFHRYQGFDKYEDSDWCRDSDWYKEIDGEKIAGLSSGTGVIVAVIDTGIDLENPLFLSRVFVNKGEISGDLIDNDENGYADDCNGWDMGDRDNDPQDENGHGTEVASVILTLSPDCKILPIKVNQSRSDSFSTADLVEGIYYAVSLGAKVINLSLTVDQDSEAVKVAVQAAHDAGAIVVAAAGNDAGGVEFPASMDEVIAVGGLYNDSPAWFSPEGPEMEITAPGVAVKLKSLGGTDVYASGTSFSCAMVSGAAADLLGMNPHLKNKTVRLLLDSGARDLGETGKDYVYGEGAMDGNLLFNESVPQIVLPFRPFYAFSKKNPISVSFHLPPTDTLTSIYIGVLLPHTGGSLSDESSSVEGGSSADIDSSTEGGSSADKDILSDNGILPGDSLYWLDADGIWHDSALDNFAPIARPASLSQCVDGVLFGENGGFEAFNPAGLFSGLYKWGIVMEDQSGRLLSPVIWTYMLLF